jgi:methionine-rich copper-binding protein CopC
MRKRLLIVAGALATLAARSVPVLAHAFLDHADPRVGSTVSSPPPVLTLAFTEPIEAAFSRIEVTDAAGKRIETGSLEHPAPATIALSLPRLAPGRYTVTWAVVSVDTHPTEGKFVFSVKEP